MVGNNDRIHGYNQIYRANSGNFASFELRNNRPDPFRNQPVTIVPSEPQGILDHQGHIVPQQILNRVLDNLANQMAKEKDLAGVNAYIDRSDTPAWLSQVRAYGTGIGAPMFDFDETKTEDRVGGFFSIVTWNPINICRAPGDNHRNGVPGERVDNEVVNWINANQGKVGVPKAWIDLLLQLRDPVIPTNNQIDQYIAQCCASLEGQRTKGIGYYAFPWVRNRQVTNNPLIPQL